VSKAHPGIVVKRSEQEFRDWISTEDGFLSTFTSYNDQRLTLEPYQAAFVRNARSYRCVEKSRQTGYSFVFACEALARTHLRHIHNAIFVSYNLADAKEKIAYCQQLHDELPLEYQKKRIVDSKLELAFRSNSAHGKISRIISNPSKAPRGKKGDIYLDELAHCANDREIYKGSTALILRSGGQLTVCSTPLGRRGQFWEIALQEVRPFKVYTRQRVPWWLCSMFCHDTRRAAREAAGMSTEQRVHAFARQNMIEQFESLLVDDFQQEFEIAYHDETMSFFPYDLILPCTDPDLDLATDFAALSGLRGRLVAGFDVGRQRDRSVLAIFHEPPGSTRKRCVMLRVYDRVEFETQKNDLRYFLSTFNVGRFAIDNSLIGMQLAEDLAKEFPQVVRVEFTQQGKELMCTDFKIALQSRAVELPRDASFVREIHSIKKSITATGKARFDAERTVEGHADRFWASALACQKPRGEVRVVGEIGAHVIGESQSVDGSVPSPEPSTPLLGGLLLVRPHSTDPESIATLERAIEMLPKCRGSHFERTDRGYAMSGSSLLLRTTGDPAFVAFAVVRQGYALDAEVVPESTPGRRGPKLWPGSSTRERGTLERLFDV
jgi:phage FluMu gp28-like protein